MKRILILAGSDSGGGAGLQADIKTVTVLGGFAMTAVSAITVQNTLGVRRVHALPADLVVEQARAVLEDLGADAIKIGMLGERAVVRAVAGLLATLPTPIPVVLDPVLVAKGGHGLLAADAVATLVEELVPLATVVTPNVPEAQALLGHPRTPVRGAAELVALARELGRLGPAAWLAKGGHLEGDELVDVLVEGSEPPELLHGERLHTRHSHGTGCTLASALATLLAQGHALAEAALLAQRFTRRAIANAPGLGAGHGPLGHLAAARDLDLLK